MAGKTNGKKKRKIAHFGSRYIEVVDSTMINKVYYDPETNTLDAIFRNGKTGGDGGRYRYRNVKPKEFAKFVLAKSLGKHFNKYIKKCYVQEKVT